MAESEEEKVLRIVAWTPPWITLGIMQVAGTPISPNVQRVSSDRAFGDLGALPVELLHIIMAMLDLKSLTSMSCTCTYGTAVAKSLPGYRSLILHAPNALFALAKTDLARHHSVAELYEVLVTDSCICCTQFGSFLFLLTCQRICFRCLCTNDEFRLLQVPRVIRAFGWAMKEVYEDRVMTVRNIPGASIAGKEMNRKRSLRLISIGLAKKLAMQKLGIKQLLLDLWYPEERQRFRSLNEFVYALRLISTPLFSSSEKGYVSPGSRSATEYRGFSDRVSSMSSIQFPHFMRDKDTAEYGFWCRGCALFSNQFRPRHTLPKHLNDLLCPGERPQDLVFGMQWIARSRKDFFEHVKDCTMAQQLLYEHE